VDPPADAHLHAVVADHQWLDGLLPLGRRQAEVHLEEVRARRDATLAPRLDELPPVGPGALGQLQQALPPQPPQLPRPPRGGAARRASSPPARPISSSTCPRTPSSG